MQEDRPPTTDDVHPGLPRLLRAGPTRADQLARATREEWRIMGVPEADSPAVMARHRRGRDTQRSADMLVLTIPESGSIDITVPPSADATTIRLRQGRLERVKLRVVIDAPRQVRVMRSNARQTAPSPSPPGRPRDAAGGAEGGGGD